MRIHPLFYALLVGAGLFSCGPSPDSNAQAEAPQTTPAPAAETVDLNYDPEARLSELGIELKLPAAPAGNYVNAVRTGNLLFLAGKGVWTDGEHSVTCR